MKTVIYEKLFLFCALLFISIVGSAQTLEPRLYSNVPKDLNFLVVGYAYTQGALADSPSLGLTDPELNANIAFVAYARGVDVMGKSAKIDLVVPSMCIDGEATKGGEQVYRDVCGLGDMKARFSINLFGAPALSINKFSAYEQDTIVGMSLQVTMPTGQYDSDRLVNISTNRWALKPSIGVSKAIKDFIFELSADAEFYTENSEFFGGNRRDQDPVYSTQLHVIYTFMRGVWLGVDVNYYYGGVTNTNGVAADDALSNSRYGATLALPINRYNSVKLYGHSGVVSRTGTDFDMFGLAWQYRFGGGI